MYLGSRITNDTSGFSFNCGCQFIMRYNNKERGVKKKIRRWMSRCSDLHRIFGCSLGSELTEQQRNRKERRYYKKMRYEAMMAALWDKGIKIPRNLTRLWDIKYPEILESTCKYTGEHLFKFSYHPKSCEFIFAPSGTHHNPMVLNYGHFPFDEYVRGIYFREKKIIYLRMHENIGWLKRTAQILRYNGVWNDIRIIWGEKAATELEDDLKGL